MAQMKIKRAATEQEVWFPTVKAYDKYLDRLEKKGVSYEVINEAPGENGGVLVYLRRINTTQVDYLPRKTGEWKRTGIISDACSVCGHEPIENVGGYSVLAPFCPFCGADLRKKKYRQNIG